MTTVIDASVVGAALLDSGPDGRWAEAILASRPLIAPHLLPVEVASIVRRAALRGRISRDAAALAQRDAVDLAVTLFPFQPFAARVWELHENVTSYDGWSVALAENFGAPLATLDRRLRAASGPRCEFLTPTESDE